MPTIALDATYAIDPEPSGIAVYSRRLIASLAAIDSPHKFLLCYRVSRFNRRKYFLRPQKTPGAGGPQFATRLYQEPFTFWLPFEARIFHSLAQRPPAFRFKREIVTVFDIFPINGRDYSTPDFQRRFSALLEDALARASRVITLSESTACQLVDRLHVPRGRIRIIPGGVDLPTQLLNAEERRAERERWVGAGNKMVLSVGVIQTRKNTMNMVRALAGLPQNYRLVLAGGNGHGSEEVHNFIRSDRLQSRIATPGYVQEHRLPLLYQAASVFLFPSFEEGFGLPILEAMSYGTPVVASNTSCLPEVGGDAAIYADPHRPDEIAAQVERVVNDSELRERMVQKGLARAREFSWRRAAEETLEVYEELI